MRKLTARPAAPLLRALLLTFAALACLESLPAAAQAGTPTTPVPTNTPPAATATRETPTQSGLTIHVVQRDENLFRIAQQYGVTVDAIAQANGLTDKSLLQVGQRLLIPGVAPDAAAAQSAPGSSDPAGGSGSNPGAEGVPGVPNSTIVQPGDSLFSLSVRYGMDETALARTNKILNPNQALVAGLSVAVQEGSQGYTPVKSGSIYVVQPGDTVYRVALRYGVSLALLMKVNRLKAIPVIFAGERLIIPGPANGPTLDDLAAPFDRVTMLPSQPEQGRTMEWVVNMAVPSTLSGHFMGKTLAIYGDPSRQHFVIPFGIDAFAKPGSYALDVTSTDDQAKQVTLTRNIMVEDGHYPSEEITLPPDQKDLLDPKVTQPEI